MKKQLLAYTRQTKGSNRQHSNESAQLEALHPDKDSPSIYHAVLGQMADNHGQYISKLLGKQDRSSKNVKAPQNRSMNIHERTKSYTNIIMDDKKTNGQTKSTNLTFHSKITEPTTSKKFMKTNLFFSHKNSPVHRKVPPSPERKKSQLSSKSFLAHLDNYIAAISYQKPGNEGFKSNKISQQKKNASKSKENTSYIQLLHKLETSEKKIKDLKLNNHILKIEETKNKKKNKELKEKLHEMLEHIRVLNKDLQKEKKERRKIEAFLKEFQQKVTLVCPKKKSLQYFPEYKHSKNGKKIDDYLMEENTTEQDEEIQILLTKQHPISDARSRSSRKGHYSGSKTYKFKQIHEFNEESSDSLCLPSKHFEESSESQIPYS